MRFKSGDILKSCADTICIPTNGIVKPNGQLVMGKGLARSAALAYPDLPTLFGSNVRYEGNKPSLVKALPRALYLRYRHDQALNVHDPVSINIVDKLGQRFINFPTKQHYSNNSSLSLIEQSLKYLIQLCADKCLSDVAVSKFGCGNGNLDWVIVQPLMIKYLDDRFICWNL